MAYGFVEATMIQSNLLKKPPSATLNFAILPSGLPAKPNRKNKKAKLSSTDPRKTRRSWNFEIMKRIIERNRPCMTISAWKYPSIHDLLRVTQQVLKLQSSIAQNVARCSSIKKNYRI